MESRIRGLVEKQIDLALKPVKLGIIINLFKTDFPCRVEDATFGFIVGNTLANFLAVIRNRDATDDEVKEFFNIIKRRTMEIQTQIKYVMEK